MMRTENIPVWKEFGYTPRKSKAPSEIFETLIVGGGPIGLALALDFGRKGRKVVVVNALPFIARGSKAICFSKRSLEIYDRLGGGERLLRKGVVWEKGKVFWKGGAEPIYEFDLLPVKDQKFPAFINIQQYYVEEYLLDEIANYPNIDIRWRHEAAAVTPRADGVLIEIETPDERYAVEAQYLLACDGNKSRPWTIMEVCGGQTHTIVRFGLDELLPREVQIVHGPGCPVCVTPLELIDQASALAARKGIVLGCFGGMVRVPGSTTDLFACRAAGGEVRVLYSPLDALQLARRQPDRQVVFFAVGFETTAPTTAMAVWQAKRLGLQNFSVLMAHVRVPPAIEAILTAPGNRVQGFLAAGHVCTVMGAEEYEALVRQYRVPIVITGFEPLDLLQGVWMCLKQLEEGRAAVENQYARSVRSEGNPQARMLLDEVFVPVDAAGKTWQTFLHAGRDAGLRPVGMRALEWLGAQSAESAEKRSGWTHQRHVWHRK